MKFINLNKEMKVFLGSIVGIAMGSVFNRIMILAPPPTLSSKRESAKLARSMFPLNNEMVRLGHNVSHVPIKVELRIMGYACLEAIPMNFEHSAFPSPQ